MLKNLPTIKLVIWDLDDTFWDGTISEGEIRHIEDNIELVKYLAHRGIISTIVSKNDFSVVERELRNIGIWDYFVHPSVNWLPKGQRIKKLIDELNLRDINCLFLDDNLNNLKEASFYNPNLHTATPDLLGALYLLKSFVGKDDSGLSRLNQYKNHESRIKESSSYLDNLEFLRDSRLRLQFNESVLSNLDRAYELISRTNQLNFTKRDIHKSELIEELRSGAFRSFVVEASDRFGSAGIIGFVHMHMSTNRLVDFCFSCRMMNAGIEQYVYRYLGCPEIVIKPDVSSDLNEYEEIDWISLGDISPRVSCSKSRVLFKGGCDLERLVTDLSENVVSEINKKVFGGVPSHAEHTELILSSFGLSEEQKIHFLDDWPFFDKDAFSTEFFSPENDVIVYSVLMDYTQELYRHKGYGYIVPFGGYGSLMSEGALSYYKKRYSKIADRVDHLESVLSRDYEYLGQIDVDCFYRNLGTILRKLPVHTKIIFLNGAEVSSTNSKEKLASQRHIEMNRALSHFITSNKERCFLLDVRERVTQSNDLTNNIRHYKPQVYGYLAEDLKRLYFSVVDV